LIFSEYLRKQGFYDYFTKLILQHDNNKILEAVVYLDKNRSKAKRYSFNKYINEQINLINKKKKILKIKHCDSKDFCVIQIADMCAGTVFQKYEKGNLEFYNLIKPLINDEWIFKEKHKWKSLYS